MTKSLLVRSLITVGFIVSIVLVGILIPHQIHADLTHLQRPANPVTMISNGHLTMCMLNASNYKVVKTVKMVITGYSSTVDQTDDTPFITASGQHVARNIVALNGVPFGTQLRIPKIYGDTVLTVGDRLHPKAGKQHIDLWFPTREEATQFGANYNVQVEILEI